MPMHTYMASSLRTKESIQLGSLLDEEQELSLTLVLRSLDQARQNELYKLNGLILKTLQIITLCVFFSLSVC